jgi:hypothetical protein
MTLIQPLTKSAEMQRFCVWLAAPAVNAPSFGVIATLPVPLESVACSTVHVSEPVKAPVWTVIMISPTASRTSIHELDAAAVLAAETGLSNLTTVAARASFPNMFLSSRKHRLRNRFRFHDNRRGFFCTRSFVRVYQGRCNVLRDFDDRADRLDNFVHEYGTLDADELR